MNTELINRIANSSTAADLLRCVSVNARDREIMGIISDSLMNPETARARDLFYFCAGILAQQHIRQARYSVAIRKSA